MQTLAQKDYVARKKGAFDKSSAVMSLENLCDAYQLLREWCSRCSSYFCCSTSHLGSSHVVPGRCPAELPRDSEKIRNVNFHRLKTLHSPARRTCSFHAEPPGSDDDWGTNVCPLSRWTKKTWWSGRFYLLPLHLASVQRWQSGRWSKDLHICAPLLIAYGCNHFSHCPSLVISSGPLL